MTPSSSSAAAAPPASKSSNSLSEPWIPAAAPSAVSPSHEQSLPPSHERQIQSDDASASMPQDTAAVTTATPFTTDTTTTTMEEDSSGNNSLGDSPQPKTTASTLKLAFIFVAMVLVGTAVSVLGKLVAIPMYNYPNFLNLYGIAVYIVIAFAYVMFLLARHGDAVITPEQRQIPKKTFAIFGLLDTLSIGVQTFASCYISGPLRILLPQAAIPFSMFFSWYFQNKQFRPVQYGGAIVVILGIFLVLEPMLHLLPTSSPNDGNNNNITTAAAAFVCETNLQQFDIDEFCYVCREEISETACLSHIESNPGTMDGSNHTDAVHLCAWVPADDADVSTDQGTVMIWSVIVILSCIPMTLSSLYKEITVSQIEVEPLYMNGWIAFFQLPFSMMVAILAAPLFSPPIEPQQLPHHLLDAWKCYFHGIGTVDHGCHLDDQCGKAFWLWNLNFIMIVLYTILVVLLLKHGSTSLLYLALTITVPLGNLAFCLPFMPGYAPMQITDILGLIVIVLGLALYRSSGSTTEETQEGPEDDFPSAATENAMESLQEPLLQSQPEED